MGISDWFEKKFQEMGDISPMGASNLGVSKYVSMNQEKNFLFLYTSGGCWDGVDFGGFIAF